MRRLASEVPVVRPVPEVVAGAVPELGPAAVPRGRVLLLRAVPLRRPALLPVIAEKAS